MKNKVLLIFLAVILLAVSSGLSYAGPSVSFTSSRRMAMGGTFAAHGEGEDVLWGNPANLAFANETHYGIFKLRLGANGDILRNIGTILDILKLDDEVQQLDMITKQLMPFKGNVDIGLMPFSIVKPNMGIAAVSQTKINIRLLRPTSPRVKYDGISDNAVYFGYSRQMPKNIIMGITGKFLYRFQTLDPASGSDEVTVGLAQMLSGAKEPSYVQLKGAGIDIGFLMPVRLPGLGDCRMGIVITDLATRITGTQRIVSGNATTIVPYSDTISKTMTIGLAWTMADTLFALDWQFVSPHQVTAKRFHFGIERKLSSILTLRGGINEGYWVGGIKAKLKGFNLEYVYSKEELGNTLLANPASMHYIKFGGQI